MSGTVKTVLIVGGVAVGVVVLFKMLQPSPIKKATAPKSNTDLVAISGIVGGLGKLFGSSGGGDSVVNTAVQTTPITQAEEDAFTSGHFGVDYSTLE